MYEKEDNFSIFQLFSKQIGALFGLFLLSLTLAFGGALLSWNAQDPSFSFANDHEISNWLGYFGAVYADLSMQFFGLAGAFFLVPLLCWACFLILQKLDFSLWRCVWCYPLFLVAFCFVFSLPVFDLPQTLPQGAGGRLGRWLFSFWQTLMPLSGFFWLLLAGILGLAFGFFWLFIACGLLCPKQKNLAELNKKRSLKPLGFWEGWVSFFCHIYLKSCGTIVRNFAAFRCRFSSLKGSFANKKGSALFQEDEQELICPAEQELHDHSIIAPALVHKSTKTPEKYLPNKSIPLPESLRAFAQNYHFSLPSLSLLSLPEPDTTQQMSRAELQQNAERLLHVLKDFGIHGQMMSICSGPIVTLYEFEPAPGIKSSRIIGLAEDIARSMCAISARVSVIAGRNAIGIELPNAHRQTVYLREILESQVFLESSSSLALALGKMIDGEVVVADLAKMPHLLVAGTTGSGKSVAIHSMILSLLYRLSPQQCRFVMVDPKMLELSIYDGIPHLLTPVVTDPKKAVVALKWAVREMEERYAKMAKVGVRNIDSFNQRLYAARERGENLIRKIQTGFEAATGKPIYEEEVIQTEPLPYIVVVIDEMADLMLVAGKEIEAAVQRLAQMARAAGIHVIMATQRPSVDVITGTIKANFPTRISFSVTSKIDSRTILDEQGAEQLLGQGDMLFMFGGRRPAQRVHAPFVLDHEVNEIVNYLKSQAAPHYLDAILEEDNAELGSEGAEGWNQSEDPYDQAVAIMLRDKKISTSYIQRRLAIGYNRAASIVERMEQEGLISPPNHVGKRKILVLPEDS